MDKMERVCAVCSKRIGCVERQEPYFKKSCEKDGCMEQCDLAGTEDRSDGYCEECLKKAKEELLKDKEH